MRVLQVHCRYKSGPAGEDSVVHEELQLLRTGGVEVSQYFGDNGAMARGPKWRRPLDAARSIWNQTEYRAAATRIREFRPDIVHVHNTFAALSPSVLWAAKEAGRPVVMTLHNYRLLCATSILLRDNRPCQKCVGHFPWAAVRHGCQYNDSFGLGISIATSQAVHHLLGTYTRAVTSFIALTEFQRDLFVKAGIPGGRIHVKPNFVADSTPGVRRTAPNTLLFAGKVSTEKGVDLLTSVWSKMQRLDHTLVVAGDGPAAEMLRARHREPNLHWRGRVPRSALLEEIRRAKWLVVPSRWYEGFPMIVAEALANAVPVITPDHGGFRSIVPDEAGLRFQASDERDLADQLARAIDMPANQWLQYSDAARATYLSRYTPELNYQRLLEIYEAAIAAPVHLSS